MPLPIELPISMLAPVRVGKTATNESCGLFFPYLNLALGLVIDWEGDTHLIHLDGPTLFKEGPIGIGNPIRGVVINDLEYRVDPTSRFKPHQDLDPPGALVLKGGNLYLMCLRHGREIDDEPYEVPVAAGFRVGGTEESCGFTRWSIAIREGEQVRVIRPFEALPRKE